jgi:hypothetical protein
MSERRTFNTAARARWNAPIHQCLKAIDAHTELFLLHRSLWHGQKAEILRQYVAELKEWIHEEETKCMENVCLRPRSQDGEE